MHRGLMQKYFLAIVCLFSVYTDTTDCMLGHIITIHERGAVRDKTVEYNEEDLDRRLNAVESRVFLRKLKAHIDYFLWETGVPISKTPIVDLLSFRFFTAGKALSNKDFDAFKKSFHAAETDIFNKIEIEARFVSVSKCNTKLQDLLAASFNVGVRTKEED